MNKLKVRFMLIVLDYILSNSGSQNFRLKVIALHKDLSDELEEDKEFDNHFSDKVPDNYKKAITESMSTGCGLIR